MYNQLIPEQRSQIFVLLQSKTEKKVIASTRLFHLRLRCILNERGIFIVKTMGVWLVYFVDFQQNKCLKISQVAYFS